MASPEVVVAATPDHFAAARRLIAAYVASLGVDLDFQDYDVEIDELEARYGPPGGRLLLAASSSGEWIGCVAVQRVSASDCEMKRLYVAPSARGSGLGAALVDRLLREARAMGYSRMLLDTLPGMDAAQGLYRRFGFRERDPYRDNPVVGARFMEVRLRA